MIAGRINGFSAHADFSPVDNGRKGRHGNDLFNKIAPVFHGRIKIPEFKNGQGGLPKSRLVSRPPGPGRFATAREPDFFYKEKCFYV